MFEVAIKINCPSCKKTLVWSDTNPYRPFCCKHCQLIDLRKWLLEEQGISNSGTF